MAGRFEVFADKAGKSRFRLKSSNGETVLASQGYASKSGCKNGIESVKKNARSQKNFEKKDGSGGKFRFNLLAANKKVIATSESYNTARARDNGIKAVQKSASGAPILDV